MILRQFPDLQWLKKQTEARFQDRKAYDGTALKNTGWPSVALLVKTNAVYRDNIRGPVSIFANVSGSSFVHCDNKRTKISSEYFYVTNQDQRYTLEVEKNTPTEIFNIHFGEQWADELLKSHLSDPKFILDHPYCDTPFSTTGFYNKLYPKDGDIKILFQNILKAESTLEEEEAMAQLLTALLQHNGDLKKKENQFSALKSGTKSELMKRLLLSTDYIYTNIHQDLSLDELASVSCLSKFHFLRLFKIAFRKTPLQFVQEVKIKHAIQLLKNSQMEVNEVASVLGFNNSSSFSRLFRNHVGVYPTQLRS